MQWKVTFSASSEDARVEKTGCCNRDQIIQVWSVHLPLSTCKVKAASLCSEDTEVETTLATKIKLYR